MPPDVMRWSQLVVLMALGEGPEVTLSGQVTCRWFEPVRFANFPATGGIVDDDQAGPMSVYEASYRIVKLGDRVRRERLDGSISSIEHGTEFWTVAPGDDVAVHHPAAHMTFPDLQLTRRRSLQEWSRDDYTHPTGPAQAVTYLDRAAWQVDVAPPQRKRHPLTWIVDDQTGHILSAASAGGAFVRWDHLDVDTAIDPAVLVWSGPSRRFTPGDRRPPPA